MVKCGDCRHYKDRYTLYLHGGFPVLRRLLELNKVDDRDFICEGWGCVFRPLENFAHDEYDLPILEEDFDDIECEHFEPRKDRQELAKKIFTPFNRGKFHLDISDIEIEDDFDSYSYYTEK